MNLLIILITALSCNACQKDSVQYGSNDLKVEIIAGSEWLHDFPLFLGIKLKNPPQIAIWAEDPSGNYLSTLYVTKKAATQSWISSGGNRRKEALPVWCHMRNVQYEDGLYLPTKKRPLTDGISGATPKATFNLKVSSLNGLKKFVIKIEINHSTDFNDFYPESAQEGTSNYSGGKMGSGQPALVYSANVDLTSDAKEFRAELAGHSSPDGSNGNLYPDTSTLTTALHIVKQIVISKNN